MAQTNNLNNSSKTTDVTMASSLKSIVKILEIGNNRLKKINNPVTRYSLLLDRLCTISDVGLGVLEANCDDPELLEQVKREFAFFQEEINRMMVWIESPSLTPDEPMGEALMRECIAHANKVAKEADVAL
jgi:hypothetical protein